MRKGHEISTIDVAMVTITVRGTSPTELALTTSNKVAVEPATETTDAVKNIVKGVLLAQKPEQITLTGNKITLTDNVFNPELAKILQGGTVLYWGNAGKTITSETDLGYGLAGYTPPVVGSTAKGDKFELNLYSAIYNAAGTITGYEKCTYPNCKGQPIGLGSEDNVFRAPEYTITSAPDNGEAPYTITYVDSLPEITRYTITQDLTHVTSSNSITTEVEEGLSFITTLTADDGYTIEDVAITMGDVDVTAVAWDASIGKVTISAATGNIVVTATAVSE